MHLSFHHCQTKSQYLLFTWTSSNPEKTLRENIVKGIVGKKAKHLQAQLNFILIFLLDGYENAPYI